MEQKTNLSERLLFLDILRGIATLWMIPTHVLGILLNPEARSNYFYQLFLPSTGYVAVAFIFCAGSGFWIASLRKQKVYRALSWDLLTYLRRLAFVLLAGYWINLPTLSFSKMVHDQIALQYGATFDVLHVIVVASLLALLIFQFIKSEDPLKWAFLICGVIIFALAPLIWAQDNSHLPWWFASAFSRPPLGKFPFFPWVGYFFMGAALTAFFINSKNRVLFAALLVVLSGMTPDIVLLIHRLPFTYPGWPEWWYCNPGNSFLRLSKVTFLFGLLFLLEPLLKSLKYLVRPLQLMGQESLQVYVFHIMIIYGGALGKGLSSEYGSRLSFKEGLGWTFLLTLFCFITAGLWHVSKKNYPRFSKTLLTCTVSGLFLYFMIH